MRGSMFMHLKRLVKEKYPEYDFGEMCKQAGLPTSRFIPSNTYSDEEFHKLMCSVSVETAKNINTLWREFGEESIRYFFDTYRSYVWQINKFTDLILSLNKIHDQLIKDGEGTPPKFKIKTNGDSELEITYSSDRHLNHFFLGLIQGAAKYFNTEINLTHKTTPKKCVVKVSVCVPEKVPME